MLPEILRAVVRALAYTQGKRRKNNGRNSAGCQKGDSSCSRDHSGRKLCDVFLLLASSPVLSRVGSL